MAQAYADFPHELNRNIVKELDPRFWTILMITFVAYFSLIFYMKSIPYVPNVAMQQKLLKQLYRVEEVTTQVQVTDLSDLREQKKQEEEKKAEEEKIEKVETKRAERAKMTDAEKKANRADRKKSRDERAASLKQKVQSMNVFSAAGARSGGGGIGKKSGKGSGARKFSNIVGSNRGIAGGGAASLGGGKKLVTGGAVADESADIEIVEGGSAEIEGGELGGGLEMEEIEEVKGEGAESSLRTPDALNDVFRAQQAAISRCFERFKKRDPQLNGRLVISMTIMPDGTVERVSIQSQWSNVTLGGSVDDCIRKRVERWRFDPIDKGDVKIELPMSFY